MNSKKLTEKIIGVLFIFATVMSILSVFFIESLDAPDYLTKIAASENQVLIGMLIQSIWALSVVGIPIMLYPIMRKNNETLAIGFFSLRFIEGIFTFLGILFQLSLLTLSKEFLQNGALGITYYEASGIALQAARHWAFWVGPSISFALSAIVLNYALYQSKIVPRWLSGWGLIGSIIYLPAELLALFGLDQFMVLAILLAVQEMALALWLITKGFNTSTIAFDSSNADIV